MPQFHFHPAWCLKKIQYNRILEPNKGLQNDGKIGHWMNCKLF